MNWSELGLQVLSYALPVLSSVLVVVLTALAKKLLDKFHLEHEGKVDAMIDRYVEVGVKHAERWAATLANKPAATDKMGVALKTVLDELESSGVKGVGEALIKARIEAWLEGKEPLSSKSSVSPA
jgi:hypothetical protein